LGYATMLIAASAGIIVWTLMGHGITDPAGRPVGTDFVSFWTVSAMLHNSHERAIYVPEALAALERSMVPGENAAFYAWQYPPIGLLLVYPLALFSYLWSLAIWLALGVALYLTVLWRILPQPLTLWAGLAFPGVILTIEHGQNAFFTTGLLGWALLLLPRRPVAAGIFFGLLSFKPQLGVLLPVALISGGQWRTVIAAALTGLGLVATTFILLGGGIWSDFLASLQLSREMLDSGLVPYYKMQSIFAAVRLVGGPLILAYSVQAVVGVVGAATVAWAWRRPTDPDMKNGALLLATPLATPFIFDYDLMLVAPAIAWLASKGVQHRLLPWEGTTLAVLSLIPLVSRAIGELTHTLLAPLAVSAGLAAIVVRIRAESLKVHTHPISP
jgi:alpha-1,2-mannosyltransferase